MMNAHRYSQAGAWEQGRSPVGADCYHTTINLRFEIKYCFNNIINISAMAIAPYGFLNLKSLSAKLSFLPMLLTGALENSTLRNFLKILKHYNLTYSSQKLFFNVKIVKKYRS